MKKEAEFKKEGKLVLSEGFDINYAINYSMGAKTQEILDLLTSLSLAKAYCLLCRPDHLGCWCYFCHLHHMVLRT